MCREWLKIVIYQEQLVSKEGGNLGHSVRLSLKNLAESSELSVDGSLLAKFVQTVGLSGEN